MKTTFFLSTLLATFLPLTYAQDALTVLRQNGLTAHADAIEADPALVAIINGRDDIQIFAPPNSVYEALESSAGGPQRRQTNRKAQTNAQTGKKPPAPLRKRQDVTPFPASNFEELISVIDEQWPEYCNLGPGQPQRFVTNAAGSPGPAGTLSGLQITTGGGNVVDASDGPFKYDKGIIYVVAGFFTLPQSLSQTLVTSPIADRFAASLTSSLSTLESTPGITVFVPVDSALAASTSNSTFNPDDYIHVGLGYTTKLYPGETYKTKSGKDIKIEFGANGGRTINGRNVVTGNVPLVNGVLHFVDGDIWDATTAPPTPNQPGQPGDSPIFDGGAVRGGVSRMLLGLGVGIVVARLLL